MIRTHKASFAWKLNDEYNKRDILRFKVHLQVIDNTGSTTFILFDRVVSQVLGRTVHELLDGMANRNHVAPYPPDLDIFVDKHALFKVEVNS